MAGFREALNFVGGGGALIITPDGPRGPNEVIASGALQIAKRTAAPVFLMGMAANPALRLDTWDQVMLPTPFGRGVVVWEGPLHVPPGAGEAEIAALGARLRPWSAPRPPSRRRPEAHGPRPRCPFP